MKLFYRKHYQKIITELSNLPSPNLSSSKQEELKSKIMANISQVPQVSETTPSNNRLSLQGWNKGFAYYAFATLIIIFVSTATAQAASFAQPGDVLYPAKLIGESLQLGITIRAEQKAELQAQIAERRLEESLQLWVNTVEIPADAVETETELTQTPARLEADNSDKLEDSHSNGPPKVVPARKLTEEQAKAAAEQTQARFHQALEALKATQTKLENKGNQRAAEAVKSNIERLEAKAQQSTRGNKNNEQDNNS